MTPSGLLVRLGLVAALAGAGTAQAATFLIIYTEPNGQGFKDATPVSPVGGNSGTTRGKQRANVLEFALERWGERLQSNVQITIDADFNSFTQADCTPNSGVLGFAGPNLIASFPGAPRSNTFFDEALAAAATGVNQVPNEPDIQASFNRFVDDDPACLGGRGFYYGLDHANGNQIDFLNVVMHELTHGLGFVSLTDPTDGTTPSFGGNEFFGIMDRFLFDATRNQFWTQLTPAQRAQSATSNGSLQFNGTATNAGSSFLTSGRASGRARLFAPAQVNPGSSVSHWDTVSTPNLVMEPFINNDLIGSQQTDLSTCAFQDFGWSVLAPFNCPDQLNAAPANRAPTLDPIPDQAPAGTGAQAVNLTGISAGAAESQTLTVTAVSNNPGLVPNPSINYTSPNATGSLTYTPAAGQSGTATITVTVRDNGGTANGGVDRTSRSFDITVTGGANQPPTLDVIPNPAPALEDAGTQTVALSGISAGAGESQVLSVTAVSSNPGLTQDLTVSYVSPAATGSVSYTPPPNASGTATITVTVADSGSSNNTISRSFTVTVAAVNDPPTLDPIASPPPIAANAGTQTVNLVGIGAGGGESQTLTVTATSSNPGLIPNPSVSYTSPAATGSVTYAPVAGQSGSAQITVTVRDSGGTANGGSDVITRRFDVNVSGAANQPPTLNAIADPAPVLEDSGPQTFVLSGISAGGGENQALILSASSSNPELTGSIAIVYASPAPTGTLTYVPVANRSGTATITVTVRDTGSSNNTVSRSFDVTVTPVNDAPTLNAIANPPTLPANSGAQAVGLTGIGAGGGESQTLTVTAASSNPALIPNPAVNYTSPAANGTLSYTPVSGQSGSAVVTVTVRDNGGTASGGVDVVSRTFVVNVGGAPANTPPDARADSVDTLEDTAVVINALANDSDLDGDTLTLTSATATSGAAVVLDGLRIAYTPAANFSGPVSITYAVADGRGGSDSATVTVAVIPVNDPPLAGTDAATVAQGSAETLINVLANDSSSPEANETLSVIAVGLPSNGGSVSIKSGGLIGYTPASTFSGTESFAYTISDGNGGTTTGAVHVTVTPSAGGGGNAGGDGGGGDGGGGGGLGQVTLMALLLGLGLRTRRRALWGAMRCTIPL